MKLLDKVMRNLTAFDTLQSAKVAACHYLYRLSTAL